MGQLSRAVEFGNEFMKKYPQFKTEVMDLFELMQDEISEGSSVQNEIELFISACDDLLLEEK